MDTLMIIMRIIHIFAGVFWVGSTFLLIGYIEPTVAATGDSGRQFMSYLGTKTKFSPVMALAGTLSLLSGLVMYYIIFDVSTDGLSSGYGLSLTVGAIAGIIALITGFVFQGRSAKKMRAVAAEMEAAGGPPTPEQMAVMKEGAERIALGTRIGAVLMTIALLGMSIAQYM
jgi:putative copper export protein